MELLESHQAKIGDTSKWKFESESDLRRWLRENWLPDVWGPLVWVEAAPGGTVGAPDVYLPYTDGSIAVELKHWEYSSRGKLHYNVRPSQKRMHRLLSSKKIPSAFLVSTSRQEVYAVPGFAFAKLPMYDNGPGVTDVMRVLRKHPICSLLKLRAVLADKSFYKPEP